jgi:thiamine pyrophosphokinase
MRFVVFANGIMPDSDAARGLIRPDDVLIAADGGSRHALAMGLVPAVIIGDLDSLLPDQRQLAEQAGARILPFPTDKNQTDLELALDYVLQQGGTGMVVIAALGGRLDQTLGNLSLLSDPRFAGARIDDGVEEVFFCREQAEIRGRGGEVVSLIPWGGPVTGIRTQGLRWPLSAETLAPTATRGISNEMLGEQASVEISTGLLLIVHRRSLITDN